MVRWKKIAAILAPVLLLSACGSTQSASSANDSSTGPNAVISVNGTEPQVSLVPMNTGEVGGDAYSAPSSLVWSLMTRPASR